MYIAQLDCRFGCSILGFSSRRHQSRLEAWT